MNKLLLGKIIAVILIVGAIGTVGSLYFHLWNPSWNPFPEKPEVVLAKMMKNLERVKTYHTEGNFLGKAILKHSKAQAYSPEASLSIKGDEDRTDKDNPKSYSDLKGSFSMMGMEFKGEIEVIEASKDVSYMRIKEFPVGALDYFYPGGADDQKVYEIVIGKWIKIDRKSVEKYYKKHGMSGFVQNREKQKEITEKLMNILKSENWVKVKENKGGESCGDKICYHYLLTINKEAVKGSLPEILKIGMEYYPVGYKLSPEQEKEMNSQISKAVDNFFDKIGDIDFDIWIGRKDKLPYKISFEKKIDINKFANKKPLGSMSNFSELDIEGRVDFSEFDRKVDIREPESYETFESVISKLNKL